MHITVCLLSYSSANYIIPLQLQSTATFTKLTGKSALQLRGAIALHDPKCRNPLQFKSAAATVPSTRRPLSGCNNAGSVVRRSFCLLQVGEHCTNANLCKPHFPSAPSWVFLGPNMARISFPSSPPPLPPHPCFLRRISRPLVSLSAVVSPSHDQSSLGFRYVILQDINMGSEL